MCFFLPGRASGGTEARVHCERGSWGLHGTKWKTTTAADWLRPNPSMSRIRVFCCPLPCQRPISFLSKLKKLMGLWHCSAQQDNLIRLVDEIRRAYD